MNSSQAVENCKHMNESNITFNIGGNPVYKDQCMKCYDDPQSERGLDVCLKCFSGNCRSEMFNHSNLHYMQKNHPLVLNIKETLIKEENSNVTADVKKITKIAIGKPGGMDLTSDEKWERWLNVRCLVCQMDIDYEKNQILKDLVTSIINTSSGEKKADIAAWELDVNPCEHTLTLQQNEGVHIASKLKATCNDCNLSSALWLCLTCGNLACGRKNFDGTGGNGHAMTHYQKTKHPLVVKTGTITPEGEASLYCYSCDDEVKDPDLSIHLSNLGVDVSTQVKTEKTMTELNLEMNLNFTLSKAYEEGKLLQPIYGAGHTGLENLGNSCYMNSVLQVLFSLEHFQKLYLDNALEHLSTCYLDPLECFYCQISKIMYGIHSGVYSSKIIKSVAKTEENKEGVEEYQKGIKPSYFKMFFGKGHQEFSSTRQQDAFEYLAYLLEKFERQEKINKRPNLKSVFEFDLETRMECSKCNNVKYKTQKNWYLTLNVPNWESKKDENSNCSFEEVIEKFLGEETVDLNCPQCKQLTSWTKTQRVKTFPLYLVIAFQRFVYDWVPIKLETKLQIPENFDLEVLTRNHSKVGEKVIVEDNIVEEEEEVEPEVNKDALNLLLQNGVPELAAKHALIQNDNNPDFAICWYFDNMDNPVLSTPLLKIKKPSGKKNNKQVSINVPEDLVEMVMSILGCSRVTAEGALKKCDINPERAVDYILSHPEENFEEPQQEQVGGQISVSIPQDYEMKNVESSQYGLYAFITHLGKNTSHGHYVCHIKKGDNWVYYNDSKVSISNDPPAYKAYIYVYKNNKN